MEEQILRLMDETKVTLNTAAIIKMGIVLVLTIAAVVALTILHKRLRKGLESRNEIRKAYAYRVAFRVIRALVYVTGLIAILQSVGIRLTGLSASLGLMLIMLALAVKDALQDIFAGLVIMSDKYFNVGDAVEFEGKDGVVISLTARTTKIELIDDRSVLSIANRNISKIRKLTHLVDIDLPLPYELGGKEAISVLQSICTQIGALEGVESCELKGTQEFGASAVLYKVRFFCEPHDRPDIRRAVMRTIQDGLEAANIRIPYQQIDIHTHS